MANSKKEEEERISPLILIPGLPNEMALYCLAKTPLHEHATYSDVSPTWRVAMQQPILGYFRRAFGITHQIILLCLSSPLSISDHHSTWFLLDTSIMRIRSLPRLPISPSLSTCYSYKTHIYRPNKAIFVVIMALNNSERFNLYTQYLFFNLHILEGRWSVVAQEEEEDDEEWKSLNSNLPPRQTLTSGSPININMVLGGLMSLVRGDHHHLPLTKPRINATSFIMDSCMYVIGGHDCSDFHKVQTNGEFWNPRTGKWAVVPSMWPWAKHEPSNEWRYRDVPNVVVVQNQLFALKHNNTPEVFAYDKSSNVWNSLGLAYTPPIDYHSTLLPCYYLLGMSTTLWMLVCLPFKKMSMIAHHRCNNEWIPLNFHFDDNTNLTSVRLHALLDL